MHGVYDNLAKQGKIGPYNADGSPKAGYRAEYPKWITLPNGAKVIVQSQAEELRAIAATPADEHTLSPLEKERNELAAKLAEAEAKLATMTPSQAETVTPPTPEKPKPTSVKNETPTPPAAPKK